jgi:hypothetical protein
VGENGRVQGARCVRIDGQVSRMNEKKKKTIDDIDVSSLDLSKHILILPAGSIWYRIVDKGQDPLEPTGKAGRFSKEPPHYTPTLYKIVRRIFGNASLVGTGSTCLCTAIATAQLEVGGSLEGKSVYRITLLSDIEIIDIDSICKSEGIDQPYITEERSEFWHRFYGRKVRGLHHQSAKNLKDYNLVIFQDWFPKFKSVIKKELI